MRTATKTRKHGLQRPFNNYQIASWAVLFSEVIFAYTVYLAPFSSNNKVHILKPFSPILDDFHSP